MKRFFIIILFLIVGILASAQVPTTKYYERSSPIVNYIDNYNIGRTSYQIDKSTNKHQIADTKTGLIYNAYYYYVWFYNESIKNGYKSSTYIQSINIYIDNQFIGNYWLLITGDYYYITLYSINPNARLRIEVSNPLPY